MLIITNFIGFVKRGCPLLTAVLFLPRIAIAGPASVVFNEIAWMGTIVSPNKEWIELYNNTDAAVQLTGWRIIATDGTPGISLEKIIPAKGFYLLERTSDGTLPEVAADQIYSGALENSGETLNLVDGDGNLIDTVEATGGWLTGDNSTKQTMEREDPAVPGHSKERWQNSQNPDGTPRAANSAGPITEKLIPSAITKPLRPTAIPSSTLASDDAEISAIISASANPSPLAAADLSSPRKTQEVRENEYSPAQTFGLALLIAALGGTASLVLKIVVSQNKS